MNAYKYYLIGLLKGAIKNLGAAIDMPVSIKLTRSEYKMTNKDIGKEKEIYPYMWTF